MALEKSAKPILNDGLYKHSQTGDEIIVKNHPRFGDAQAAAAVQTGYEWVRSVSTEEIRKRELDQIEKEKAEAAKAKASEDKKTK